MAAQSLYRKWRSQTFGELVGQEHVVQTLRNAIVEGRVAHAYLFTGPRGVGKTSMARLLAKAVNCLDADSAARPCGRCTACTTIAEGRAVDVIEMDAASNTSVEDARELIERVQFRPAELRTKVYVLDEVHMLSTAAFNALLKTLEEPPDHAIFIMATTEVHKVPATILSRCQRFTFTRHGVAATATHLRRIAEAEGLALDEGVPEAIARAATGSMRDALSVLEQLASFSRGAVTLEQVHSLLGMTAAAEVFALVDALLEGDVGAALRAVGGVADQGADIRQFTRDLVERLRALLLLLASGDETLADAGEDERERMRAWAGRARVAGVLHWVKVFSGLDHQLRTSPYGHLPLELAVVEALVAPPPAQEAPAPQRVASRPAAPAPARPAAPPPPQQVVRPAAPETRHVVPQPAPEARPVVPQSAPTPAVALTPAPEVRPIAPEAAPTPAALTPAPEAALITTPIADVPSPTTEAPLAAPLTEAPAATAAQAGPSPAGGLDPEAAPAAVDRSPEAAAAANADFSVLEQVEGLWEEIKRDVRPKSPMVQALLHGVRPIDVQGQAIVLLASSPFHKENLEKAQNRRIVEDVISKHLGRSYTINCTIEAKTEARDLRGQIREARKDELVRAAMNIFEAHIVDIEPEG